MEKEINVDVLKEINGLSIDFIEKRAQPISDNTTDPQWRCRSFDGFLGPNESIKEVIRKIKDQEILKRLHVSHKQIAQWLKDLLLSVDKKRKSENLGFMAPIRLSFSPSGFKTSPQPLEVQYQIFHGHQYSLFYNDNLSKSEWNTHWNEDFTVVNTNLNLQFKIGGNTDSGIIQYIEKLGFFEGGGVSNGYRIEPDILFAVFTGIVSEHTVHVVEEKEAFTLKEPQLEMENSQKKLTDPNTTNEEAKWLKERIAHFQNTIQRMQQESLQIINQLKSFMNK